MLKTNLECMSQTISHICTAAVLVLCSFLIAGCNGEVRQAENLRESLTFFASYEESFSADFSLGDPNLYLTPSWNDRTENFEIFTDQEDFFQIHQGEGRYGNALWVDNSNRPVLFYRGEGNMAYSTRNWNGTVSFWMRVSPEDIPEGHSDPVQITASSWNDGAFFVDFTRVDPRSFRFASFADRSVWDPDERDWDEVPEEERLWFYVEKPPFHRDEWSHIAIVFRDYNTHQANGRMNGYINGKKTGTLDGPEQTFTWDLNELGIWVDYNFHGYLDELAIFDRDLSDEEIYQLYSLENGIRGILESQ